MPTREGALGRAARFFDEGGFKALLSQLVAIPSTAQEEGFEPELERYLGEAIRPWLERMGFSVAIHPNPLAGFGPILTAERIEDPSRPTVLLYGHGDTVRGLDEQWRKGLAPWAVVEEGDRWYGRGTADNKGQHALNLAALEAVLAERGGRLGANVKLVLEMAEERGSKGLREFVAAQAGTLAADALIASDGPRVTPEMPTIATGTRGTWHFDLVVKLREGGVHSGHWGGLTTDPAIRLAHALASMMDAHGRILVRDWLPGNGVPAAVRGVLAGCPVGSGSGGGEGAATIDEGWGEPGLTPAEKIYGWNSLIVLSMVSGRPENPVNAVAPDARAHCQIRYTMDSDPAGFEPALRRHLDAEGFPEVRIENAFTRMAASRTAPDHPWVRWAQESMQRSLGKPVQIIPNSSGGLPGDVFVDHLGVPLVWVPHSYNGCKQHGPDEHLLIAPAREGILAFAGLWWDLGEDGTPRRALGRAARRAGAEPRPARAVTLPHPARGLPQRGRYMPGASVVRWPDLPALGRTQSMRIIRTALLGAAALAVALPALAQPGPGAAPGAGPGGRGPGGGMTAIFDRVDANKDGRVVWEETWSFVQARFAEADRDRDGGLTQEEAQSLRPFGGRPGNAQVPPERAAQHARFAGMMFRGLDANRDGKVTLEEIRPAVEARFRGFDANGDNAVTRDELPQPGPHHRRGGAPRGAAATEGQAAPTTPR